MPEWQIERGIGEDRALLLDGDTPLAAKLRWPGDLAAGKIIHVRLARKPAGSQRGVARLGDGTEILIDRIPSGFSEGAEIIVRIKRDRIAEKGRLKRAQGLVVESGTGDDPRRDLPPDPFETGRIVRRFPHGAWEQAFLSAWTGEIPFAGGGLLLSPTPAMTVIDIDGDLDPATLAARAVLTIAHALDLLDIGGQVGIDFPHLPQRETRQQIDEALGKALAGRKLERTAMNGFGFVQIVARLEGPSLLHRLAMHPHAAAARLALRAAEAVEGAGTTLLTVHPAVMAACRPEWIEELERRTGRPARIEANANLAMEASAAQIVNHA